MKKYLFIFILSFFGTTSTYADNATLNGLGGTFPYPIYTRWSQMYEVLTGQVVHYDQLSSTEGLKQITARKVDFGASDKPLDPAELNQKKLMQFPMVIGGIVVAANLPDIPSGQLKLTGPLLADIYLGKIKKWNDPAIKALNPDLTLPNLDIVIVHRRDGSGTTFILTSYLSAISPEWRNKVGSNTIVNWPTKTMGDTSSNGIALTIKRIAGAVGGIEYAFTQHLSTISLKNQAGYFVSPSPASFKAAAENADWKHAIQFDKLLVNQPGATSWPIAAATFILLPTHPSDASRMLALLKFFDWCYRSGDQMALTMNYIPVPPAVVTLVEKAWKNEIKDNQGNSIWK